MKIHFYHRFSELDNIHEFGVVPDNDPNIYFVWVFFYLGQEFQRLNLPVLLLFPYKVFSWDKPVKTYRIIGAEKVAKLIAKRIIKIINT